jgi:putative hydroxymethylpyrimidine transport system substrate-binding protein
VDLARRRRHPAILRMDRLGVPTYSELVFVGRTGAFDERGASKVRRFLQATARGHRALRADPSAGTDALLAANRDLDRGLQEAAIRATLPVFFPAGGRPFGYQSSDEWAAYGEWMRTNGLVRRPPNAARALTNEFLPGQGLEPSD